MKTIFDSFGCQIIERGDKIFIRFDEGELVIKMVEYEITEKEAQKAMLSEKDAYEVILSVQHRGKILSVK